MADINPPNYTQIPNVILDMMADMEDSELRVVLAIARKTFGWHKERDQLSLSQLMAMTGISKPAVMAGISAAIERGLVERCPAGKQSFSYRLLVKPVYRSTEFTSKDSLPEPVKPPDRSPVNSVYTQKKDLKKKESGVAAAPKEDAAAAFVDQTVAKYRKCGLTGGQALEAVANATYEIVPALFEQFKLWRKVKDADPRVKSSGALLASILVRGDLPDDLPELPQPVLTQEEAIRRHVEEARKGVSHATFR